MGYTVRQCDLWRGAMGLGDTLHTLIDQCNKKVSIHEADYLTQTGFSKRSLGGHSVSPLASSKFTSHEHMASGVHGLIHCAWSPCFFLQPYVSQYTTFLRAQIILSSDFTHCRFV